MDAGEDVDELDLLMLGAQPQRGRSPAGFALGALPSREVATRPGVSVGRQFTVRCARRGFDLAADLAAGAVARIDEASPFEDLDRLAVALESFALTNDVAVPVVRVGDVREARRLVAVRDLPHPLGHALDRVHLSL